MLVKIAQKIATVLAAGDRKWFDELGYFTQRRCVVF
jgi:hypothetical protein